jgi:hypothetical protein
MGNDAAHNNTQDQFQFRWDCSASSTRIHNTYIRISHPTTELFFYQTGRIDPVTTTTTTTRIIPPQQQYTDEYDTRTGLHGATLPTTTTIQPYTSSSQHQIPHEQDILQCNRTQTTRTPIITTNMLYQDIFLPTTTTPTNTNSTDKVDKVGAAVEPQLIQEDERCTTTTSTTATTATTDNIRELEIQSTRVDYMVEHKKHDNTTTAMYHPIMTTMTEDDILVSWHPVLPPGNHHGVVASSESPTRSCCEQILRYAFAMNDGTDS